MREEKKALCASCVNDLLGQRDCPWHVRIVDTIPSTNTALRELAEAGGEEGEVLVALHQSAGKGSAGRSFYSPADTGLYFSILLRPSFAPSDAGYLTPAAAVAVARVLEAASGEAMRIKWVNDVYAGSRKICGILTEAALAPDMGSFRYAVIGIGINVTSPEGGFPEELRSIAGTLFKEACPDRNTLLADVLNELYTLYTALPRHDFMEEYRSRSCLIGREACVMTGDTVTEGRVETIDDAGGLVLRDGTGVLHTFRSGTVRWKENL